MNKLNLGCGFDYRPGWINADRFKECKPDVVVDINEPPWPFNDNEFDHILLKHVLEHVGHGHGYDASGSNQRGDEFARRLQCA